MRSKAEANVARWFKFLGIEYIYEPQRFKLATTTYLPDFYLPKINLYIEVKTFHMWKDSLKKADEFAKLGHKIMIIETKRYRVIEKYYKPYISHWE